MNAVAPALFYTEARGISREQFSKAVQHVSPGSNMAAIPAKRAGRQVLLIPEKAEANDVTETKNLSVRLCI